MYIKKNGFNLNCSLLLAFVFGHYLLESLGVQYVSQGGSPLFKIHIYSYILIFSVVILFLRFGMNKMLSQLHQFGKTWFISMSCYSLVVLYALSKYGISGIAYLVDTILAPIICLMLVFRLDKSSIETIVRLLAWLIFINSLVAIGEMIFHVRVLETGYGESGYFRSTALLNHPLNNGLITACLTPLLYDKTRVKPVIYFIVVFLALFSFGGRTALAVFSIFSLFSVKNSVTALFNSGDTRKVTFVLISMLLAILFVIGILVVTPIGARIFENLKIDGSAQARFDLFIILNELSFTEWLFGASSELTSNLEFFIGIEVVENYLVGWIMSYGIIVTLLLFLATYGLLYKVFFVGDLNQKIAIAAFFLVSISNNSLSSKTPALLFLYIAVFCTYRLSKLNKSIGSC